MIFESFDGQFAPIAATFFWSLGIGLLSYFLVFKTKLFNHLIEYPLVPPFLALPAIMFAFLMGFMSADAWQNFSHARLALINESAAISKIRNIPLRVPEYQKNIDINMKIYLESALNDEWFKSGNKFRSQKAQESLDTIERIIWQGSTACIQKSNQNVPCIDAATSSTFIKAIDDLRSAREQRLSLGFMVSTYGKWILAIMLALVSAVSVAAVHRNTQKAGIIALILYCLSIWITFCIATMFSNPYKWADKLEPIPLISTLEHLKGI